MRLVRENAFYLLKRFLCYFFYILNSINDIHYTKRNFRSCLGATTQLVLSKTTKSDKDEMYLFFYLLKVKPLCIRVAYIFVLRPNNHVNSVFWFYVLPRCGGMDIYLFFLIFSVSADKFYDFKKNSSNTFYSFYWFFDFSVCTICSIFSDETRIGPN